MLCPPALENWESAKRLRPPAAPECQQSPFPDLGKIAILRRMPRHASPPRETLSTPQDGPPTARTLARGADWSLFEYVCRSGPEDRPFEERREDFTIAAVVEGTFTYKCDAGKALLCPGAILLGNFGRCFECGHDHSRGDRCIALHIAPALFSEIAASTAGTAKHRFAAAMLPADSNFAEMIVALQSAATGGSAALIEAPVINIVEKALAMTSGRTAAPVALSSRDEKRISEALHYIEDNAEAPLELADLAKLANMSKYHFLRTFRQITGTPPYCYLLNLRMRRVAARLTTSEAPISAIAFDAGFGDLSTFNRRFRAIFGVSPRVYRESSAKTEPYPGRPPSFQGKREGATGRQRRQG
jgi:AraC family transcriptional regulator